ncbi:reverse transcriptase domain-containing protein [Tanacetum coccineum]
MPPTMTTRSAGRPAATSQGGGTGGRASSGGGRTRGRFGDQGDGRIDGQAQVGDQGRGRGIGRNPNGDAVNNNIRGDVSRGCMSWEDFKTLTREEFCLSNKMQKLETELWNHVMVGAGHAAYTDRFHKLARLVPHLVTPKGKRIERYVYGLAPQIRGMVEALRNGSIKKNPEKRGNGGEPSKDRNVRDDNKSNKTGNAFATTTNPVGRKNTGTVPKCTTCSTYHPPGVPCCTCFNCNRQHHFAKDCRVEPRNVNPINARYPIARAYYECGSTDHIKSACPRLNQTQKLGVNPQNQVVTVNGGQGHGNQRNQARGRAFMFRAKKAR